MKDSVSLIHVSVFVMQLFISFRKLMVIVMLV